jgi:excisionase family DNA binding protein
MAKRKKSETEEETEIKEEKPSEFIKASEVASRLDVSRNWVYDRCADGTFLSARFGTTIRILRVSVEQYIKDNMGQSTGGDK